MVRRAMTFLSQTMQSLRTGRIEEAVHEIPRMVAVFRPQFNIRQVFDFIVEGNIIIMEEILIAYGANHFRQFFTSFDGILEFYDQIIFTAPGIFIIKSHESFCIRIEFL